MAAEVTDSPSSQAHIWLGPPDERPTELDMEILSPAEKARAGEIGNTRVRNQFIAGRLLARRVLSRYTSVAPADWRFEISAGGRPEISSPHGASGLRFNLSHTDGLVACIVTRQTDSGIDLERLDRDIDVSGIAEHSFAPDEQAALRALDDSARHRRFLELWTLKEAFLKALGSGIRLRLDAITFDLDDHELIRYRTVAGKAGTETSWRFSLYLVPPQPASGTETPVPYLLAAAVECEAASPATFSCWRLDEFGRANRLDLRPIRCSA